MADQKEGFNWNGNEGGFISEKEAKAGTEAYRNSKAFEDNGGCKAHYFGGKKVLRLLAEGKAVGIRVYYAKSQQGDDTRQVKKGDADLYIVGVDKNGDDILADENSNSLILDRNWPCPPFCPGSGTGL